MEGKANEFASVGKTVALPRKVGQTLQNLVILEMLCYRALGLDGLDGTV